jgi:NAD(P)-dependent dehydrogenase (short-subunit alcohol dehydrogenase family)
MKNILITGSNRGIGLAFAREYLKRGNFVIATCRSPQEAASLHALQATYPDTLVILPLEVRNTQQIAACRDAVSQRVDRLHLLINNAGILRPAESITQIALDDLMDSFHINAAAPLMVANAFADLLAAGAPSKVVNITMPTPPISRWNRRENHIYVASRYATNILTKMLSLDLGERGITTVGLHPGYLQTDMNNYNPEAVPAEEGIPPTVDTIEAITPEQNGLALLSDGKVYEW